MTAVCYDASRTSELHRFQLTSSVYGSLAEAFYQSLDFILTIAFRSFGRLCRLRLSPDDFTPVLLLFLLFVFLFRLIIMIGVAMQKTVCFLSGWDISLRFPPSHVQTLFRFGSSLRLLHIKLYPFLHGHDLLMGITSSVALDQMSVHLVKRMSPCEF